MQAQDDAAPTATPPPPTPEADAGVPAAGTGIAAAATNDAGQVALRPPKSPLCAVPGGEPCAVSVTDFATPPPRFWAFPHTPAPRNRQVVVVKGSDVHVWGSPGSPLPFD